MKRWLLLFLVMVLVGCQQNTATPAAETAVPAAVETVDPAHLLYLDATLPVEERIDDLLGRMSLAEKIGQMTLVEKNSLDADDITADFLGGILSGGGGYYPPNTVESWAEAITGFQQRALATRLGIPLLYGADAVHGHNNLRGATIFPHNIGLGATADAELVERVARVTAVEAAATGVNWNYAPVLAVVRDVRWGRTYEGFGEDTALVTELGLAYLRGLQGDDLAAPDAILATPKHFVGDGGTAWGSSPTTNMNVKYQLDQGVTDVDEATLRAVHLPPYQAAIENGALSVMVSYSSWGGLKMHAQRYLLTDVLKGEMGFSGFVVSDWAGIDQISSNYEEAVVTAVNAGIDMNMVPYDYHRFIRTLTRAVENGDVSQARIDDAVRRILRAKFALGLFENPLPDPALPAQVGSDEHRALAREAVRKSVVLLRNVDGMVPLPKDVPTIFVAGAGADDIGIQSGGWTIEWQGKTGNITPGTTILQGIEAAVGVETAVYYNNFGRFDRFTDDNGNPLIADVGIAVVGEQPYAEGVGDSADLALSEADLQVIARTRVQSEKLVVLLVSGRPLIVSNYLDEWDALLAVWLPGTEGQGVADVLFGDYPFQGTLPYTWPRSVSQLPFDFSDMTYLGCDAAIFPYGYGLLTDSVRSAVMCPPTP